MISTHILKKANDRLRSHPFGASQIGGGSTEGFMIFMFFSDMRTMI